MMGRKVICVRCINCSHNNIAKDIRLLDEMAIFVYTGLIFIQVRAFESSIPLIAVLMSKTLCAIHCPEVIRHFT